jgi:hypothetical protein
MTTNKAINDEIRAIAGRKNVKIQKSPDVKKNQGVNDMIRSKAGRRING